MSLPLCLLIAAQTIDGRGPVSPGRSPIVGARQSVQAAEAAPTIRSNDGGPNVGHWIWAADGKEASAVRFRRTIQLKEAPQRVRAWIAADVRYRLWINGRLASRGPADVGRDYDSGPCGPWFDDVRDLTPYFHKGVNLIAVEVFGKPLVSNEWGTDRPGLKVNLRFPNESIGTDSSWKCAVARDLDQYNAHKGFRIDMNEEPVGWRTAEFDDSTWTAARDANRSDPTIVSELPPLMEALLPAIRFTRVSAGVKANLATGGATLEHDGGYTIRYGHVLSGYLGFRVNGHQGARLLIMPNEPDAPGSNRQAEIVLREGEQVVELPFMDSFSVVNIQAEGVKRPIEIKDVRCTFTSYPVRYLGEFSCSRTDYNRVWEICRWVTQICMQTHHLDSPHHQEPVSDAGDYLIESLNSLYAFGGGTLARQDLQKIGRTLEQRKFQSFHTSYSLLWVQMLLQYYDYTGDAQPVRELAPTVFRLLDRFETYLGPHGLISEAPNYMFMDWVEIEGFNLHHPPAVIGQGYMTALYYQALGNGARVAELVHDKGRADKFQQLRRKVETAFDRELWAADKGLYRDGKAFQSSVKPNQWLPEDRQIETFSTQVNTLAVACGLAPVERAGAIMRSVLARADMNCQPYFMHFVFEAMDRAGIYGEHAAKQIDRWKIVPDTQSFHEMWSVGDLSHAWNATPMFQMSGRIMGVTPLEPGFRKFRVHPIVCGLTWAKGKVPTPHGTITVSWRRTDHELHVEFSVPKATIAVVQGKSYGAGDHDIKIRI